MKECIPCGSKKVVPTGYSKVFSTEPLDIKPEYICTDCQSKGYAS